MRMIMRPITPGEKKSHNAVVSHPLQAFEWGEFREKTGVKVIRKGFFEQENLLSSFSLTLHRIPNSPWYIGHLSKGAVPNEKLLKELQIIGKREKCVFIQLEPNMQNDVGSETLFSHLRLQPAAHPFFTKHSFVLDLTKSEDELLKNMHSKTRYNIRVARKHGVEIVEDNSDAAFEAYWQLTEETTRRQHFYAHTKQYHRRQWEVLNAAKHQDNDLTSHLFLAKYQGKILTAWILFVFKDTLYYPYGASSDEHREVMASNLIMWEAIRFGKQLGLKKFDMWGALGPNPDPNDPGYGFHTFKQKYGAELVEFVGSYDLVINPVLYQAYKLADQLRWFLLQRRK